MANPEQPEIPFEEIDTIHLGEVARDTWDGPGGTGTGISEEVARDIGYESPEDVGNMQVLTPEPFNQDSDNYDLSEPEHDDPPESGREIENFDDPSTYDRDLITKVNSSQIEDPYPERREA